MLTTTTDYAAKCTLLHCLLCAMVAFGHPANTSEPAMDIIILHNNDMHSRFEQTDALSQVCKQEDVVLSKCYGGFARVAHLVREYRNGSTPVLYLNAGDTYMGTPWFNVYKDRIVSEFMNLLKPDAICLGNHEFDENVEGLLPYLNDAIYPILAANLDLRLVPELAQIKSLRNSTVIQVRHIKVGIIGYLTPLTKNITPPNDIGILDEIPAINLEAFRLKAAGVHLIIALGHSGIHVDKQVAMECPLVDLVIGGHDNTFLWNGPKPDIEEPRGPYPLVVVQPNGKRVPVVQAYAFTKYLGKLTIKVSPTGGILSFGGQPILLDASIPRDPDVLSLLEEFRPSVASYQNTIIGESLVFLNGTCKFDECNLGNMLADSMVHAYLKRYRGPNWTDACIAFLNSGGIRTSGSAGNLTMSDILTIVPFENDLVSVWVSGGEILQVLELSVHRYSYTIRRGEFLQMSGVRVVYNLTQPSFARVHSVELLCADCDVPMYKPLDVFKQYKVVVGEFMSNGGHGYTMFTRNEGRYLGVNDIDAVDEYLEHSRIIYPAVEGRIRFIGHLNEALDAATGSAAALGSAATHIILLSTSLGVLLNCSFYYLR